MAYIYYNANPDDKYVMDCVIRAIATVFNTTWDAVALDLTKIQLVKHNLQNSDEVWGEYLAINGFRRGFIPDTCPHCYTLKQFCIDHPKGVYVVGTGEHVIAVINGDYYDTMDTGDSVIRYYWERRY